MVAQSFRCRRKGPKILRTTGDYMRCQSGTQNARSGCMRWFALLALLGGQVGAEDLAKEKTIYQEHCAKCHGQNGDGKGRAGRSLDPKPTDFTMAVANDAEWFKATKFGSKAVDKSNGMEGYEKVLSDEQIRQVLAYCKTFKR